MVALLLEWEWPFVIENAFLMPNGVFDDKIKFKMLFSMTKKLHFLLLKMPF